MHEVLYFCKVEKPIFWLSSNGKFQSYSCIFNFVEVTRFSKVVAKLYLSKHFHKQRPHTDISRIYVGN